MNADVAKAIGWRQESYLLVGDGMWQHPAHPGGWSKPNYTADDLLAWLAGPDDWCVVHVSFGRGELIRVELYVHGSIIGKFEGPTLLAALEAAVLAVPQGSQ